MIEAEYAYDRSVKEARLQTNRERGNTKAIPLIEKQIMKAEAELEKKLSDLDRTKDVSGRLSEPIAVCLVRLTRT